MPYFASIEWWLAGNAAHDIEERQYALTSHIWHMQTKPHYTWKLEQKTWYSVILWKPNIIGHRRVTEIKSRGLEKNPVFLITQLCWLQVKTKINDPPYFVPSIPFSSQPFQQYCAAIQSWNKRTWGQTTFLLWELWDSLDTVRWRVYRNVVQLLKQQNI